MKYIAITLIFLMSNACVSLPNKALIAKSLLNSSLLRSNIIEQKDARLLDSYLFENDFVKFEALMKGKDSHYYWGNIKGGFGHKLLSMATSSKNWDSQNRRAQLSNQQLCRPKFVEYLISKGAIPTENKLEFSGNTKGRNFHPNNKAGHLTGAINNKCPKVIEILLSKIDKESIAIATQLYSLKEMDSYSNHTVLVPIMTNILKTLIVSNKKLCVANNSNCKALAHLKREVDLFGKREDKRRYLASNEGQIEQILNQLCGHNLNKSKYLNLIKEEKEKGKVSGYINVLKVKQWGDRAFEEGKEIKVKSNTYKKLSGKSFTAKNCS